MADKRVLRRTRSTAKAKDDAVHRLLSLPNELLDEALAYLSPDDLRRVASVSSALYRAAWRAGLYIHWRIMWMNFTPGKELLLARLNELIDHALQKNIGLWLSIWMDFTGNGPPGLRELATQMAASLARALPRLVGLSLRVCVDFLPLIYPALHNPIPLLRIFTMIIPGESPTKEPFPTLPTDILSGGAPQLRTVALQGYLIGSRPIPAFQRVNHLIIERFTALPHTPIKTCFPRLSTVQVYACSTAKDIAPLDFSGLQLHTLVVRGHDPFERIYELRNVQLENICEVHLVQYYPIWKGRLWEREIGDFAVHLRVSDTLEGWQVSVIQAQRPWLFVCHIIDEDNPFRVVGLENIPGAAQHLTSLRMGNQCLHGFLLREGISFPALRELRVDLLSSSKAGSMLWPPDSPTLFTDGRIPANAGSAATFKSAPKSFYNVSCPALATLTVFALDKPMLVQAPAAAFLGRALGCLERAKSDQPVLSLVGVDFARPGARALVNKVFSEVQKSAFVGGVSEDYADIFCYRL